MQAQNLMSDVVFEFTVAVVVNFLSVSVKRLCFELNCMKILYIAPEQTLDDVKVVILMDISLAFTTDPGLAVIAKVLQLASMETAVEWNGVRWKVVSVVHLLVVQTHACKLVTQL